MRHATHTQSHSVTWNRQRLLVYSQDEALRFLVRQTFRKLGVREVLALALAAEAGPAMGQAPDLGIVDTDGDFDAAMACLEKIRAIDPHMPVVLLLKKDDKERLPRALSLGVEDVAPKPVSGHELTLRAVDVMCAPRRMPKPANAAPPPVPLPSSSPSRPAAKGGAALMPGRALGGSGGSMGGANLPRPSGGRLDMGDAPPPVRPSGGLLDMSDAPPADKIRGGRLDMGEAATGVPRPETAKGVEAAPPPVKSPSAGPMVPAAAPRPAPAPEPEQEDEAGPVKKGRVKRKKKSAAQKQQEQAEQQQWEQDLAKSGHRKKKKGADAASLDVDSMAADHALWLETHGAQGRRANFEKRDLAGADLAGLLLPSAGFRSADLSDADLRDSRLDGADFRFAILGAANLQGADVMVAQLRHADLRLSNLQGANLRGADLSGSKLRGAKLDGANLQGVILVGADLSEADLSKVENLSQSQISKAICDSSTRLPPGLRRPQGHEEEE